MEKGVVVKYGANLSMITGKKEECVAWDSSMSLETLLSRLYEKYHSAPGSEVFKNRFSLLITLNEEFIQALNSGDFLLKDGDVITLLPPVSGG